MMTLILVDLLALCFALLSDLDLDLRYVRSGINSDAKCVVFIKCLPTEKRLVSLNVCQLLKVYQLPKLKHLLKV